MTFSRALPLAVCLSKHEMELVPVNLCADQLDRGPRTYTPPYPKILKRSIAGFAGANARRVFE